MKSHVSMLNSQNDKNLEKTQLEPLTMIERQTPELVFAIIEPLGGGAKKVEEYLCHILQTDTYNYKVNKIVISEIIESLATLRSYLQPDLHAFLQNLPHLSDKASRANKLQQWGNKFRKADAAFLAKQAIRKIAAYRQDTAQAGASAGEPIRVAHIIRSLKNEHELDFLRKLYGDMLVAISVSGKHEDHFINFYEITERGRELTATEKAERTRLEQEFAKLTAIDQYEGINHGQRVRKIYYKADLFLNNDDKMIQKDLNKFLELLFGIHIHHPNTEESMIFNAFAASLQSTCLSRQVGAVIANKHGELISTGWNDIPRSGGGLAQSQTTDEREASCKYREFCNSEREISSIIEKIKTAIKDAKILKGKNNVDMDSNLEKISSILKNSEISNLTEFSRAVHAEMEAILQIARNGYTGLRGATIYVTTYPCENCVKHILAAGIKNVIYIEPYPKSRALKFYNNFIIAAEENDPKKPSKKLIFKQFSGISPASYSKYFKMNSERKNEDGQTIHKTKSPMPLTNIYMDSYTKYEAEIAKEMIALDQETTR